jgi:DNA-binding transcriptional LysR family regulator
MIRAMELRQLRLFSAVAEELHFGRAALRLHLSQPALTYQIQRLEKDLGYRLFDRSKRRVELTLAGEALFDGARVLLGDADQLVETARRVARGEVGVLRIGCVASVLYSLFPAVVRTTREEYPDIQIIVAEKKTGDQIKALQTGRLDVGLIHLPIGGSPGLEVVPLFTERVGIALPDTHRLAGQQLISLADLAQEPFVLFPRELEPDTYDHFIQTCASVGFAPTVSQEAENVQTLLVMVSSGLGVAFLPSSVMDSAARPGVVFRQVTPAPEITTAIAWLRGHANPAVALFRDVVLEENARRRQVSSELAVTNHSGG